MKRKDQITALAELDGCPEKYWWCPKCNEFVRPVDVTYSECHDVRADGCGEGVNRFKPYLTSHDAIVSLIEKIPMNLKMEMAIQLRIYCQKNHVLYPSSYNLEGWMLWAITATPAQLCEALLRAVNKWRDE